METFLLRVESVEGNTTLSGHVTHVRSGHESAFATAEELVAQVSAHLDPRLWQRSSDWTSSEGRGP